MTKPLPVPKNAIASVNKAAEAVFRNNPRLLDMFLDVWRTEMDPDLKTPLLESLASSIKDNSMAGELLLLVGAGQVQRADNRLMDYDRDMLQSTLPGKTAQKAGTTKTGAR